MIDLPDANETDEVVKEFLVESYEGLDQLDRDLVALEHSRHDKELLARIFRCVHTIKGTCGFLGFSKLESVTHVGENLLAKLRDGGVTAPTAELTTTLLALVDAIRQMLSAVENTGLEGDADFSALIDELSRMHDGRASAPAAPVSTPFIALPIQADDELDVPGVDLSESDVAQRDVVQQADAALQADASKGSVSETNIRVDVALLDRLMTLVGELVLARNQILQHGNSAPQGSSLATASQRLNLLTTELQEGVMKTRMQPIGNIWRKLPRVVRDLAVACNKEIRLDLEGSDTELDKTIIEAIKDPLTHIVRNAADHGIETPAERVARGKAAEGQLLLRAFHEGGQVNVEITDDGRGLDPTKLKQKAVEKGIVTQEHAARMGDREAWNLIFLPGFSTAKQLSNISGRGVGMDVVKTNIEKIGGVVDVQSVLGAGTTLKIKIPLTLAIIPGLIVTTAGDRYAIPQVNLLELVRLEGAEAQSRIEMIYGTPVYRLRGNLLPLVHLNHALGFTSQRWLSEPIDVINIVVLQADGTPFGLVVDTINDTEEIVVKPLGRQLKGIPAFAGATIMGDGRVSLILDVLGLAQCSGVLAQARERASVANAADANQQRHNSQTLLIFGLGNDRRMAVPLDAVARLEEFSRASVEWAGGREVVQYRDGIMPLIRLSDALGMPVQDSEATGLLQIIVYSQGDQSVGLVVDRIIDIVESISELQRHTRGASCVPGSAVIQGRVTDMLDLEVLMRSVDEAPAPSAPNVVALARAA